ncbi:MAG: hypothetical protein K6T66_04745 [Peptococcaceae bacterium]|nr:hypothetical protein [Peptococcaceae bacterium]
MAWTLSLTQFFNGQGRGKDKDMMEELAVSVHENLHLAPPVRATQIVMKKGCALILD